MAIIKPLLGNVPQIGSGSFLAENAVIIGDVIIGQDCSIWYSAVLRGDVNAIRLGHRVNVQDNATIHCTYQKSSTHIGNDVSIGHNAIIHGCTIHDKVLVGMGAIIMDNAVVESGSIIAAGAIVTQGAHVKEGELWAGVPARKIKDVPVELREGEIERIARNYLKYSSWYKTKNEQHGF